MEVFVKKIILVLIFLNFSALATGNFNLECRNSLSISSSVLIEFIGSSHGKITLRKKQEAVSKYFEILSEAREEMTLKTDDGSLLVLTQTKRGILLKNIAESFLVNYRDALCSQ